ncbi:sugar kinase [Sphingobacterium sp. SRCM116780]|uniref:sugar kinase n=1 Tax=Sphingobacterium sp. SRCM116780 TaxID=2907623 RepID=UPI001F25ADD9|nr:sugar kinase [Sphingobacterium sp. SRCM116780]UIR56399.1 sugar kinase [Sphingobacterium sp. SRCM116780]
MNYNKVLCFGEILYRLQAKGDHFFNTDPSVVYAYPGGSEANVAVTLAALSIPSSYVSTAPNHSLTQEILRLLKEKNVDISKFVFGGQRLGSYILQSANGLSKGEVIYDRNFSSFSALKIGDIDWDLLFKDCSWLHWTALTPALSVDLSDLMLEGLRIAQEKKITISVDLNYRNKLWQYGVEPITIMPRLVAYCDVIMGNIWAENKMLGTSIHKKLDRTTSPDEYFDYASTVAQEIFEKYPKCKHVANTFRFMDNAQHNLFYGTYHSPLENKMSQILETNEVIDRIGSGDAFMGGLIAAIYQKKSSQQIIDTATEIGFKKLFNKGDFLHLK